MSSCIYDDSPAVGVCPNCDFGVCQDCLDGGSEGVCRTCSEERAHRRQSSAIQREYETPASQARRCNYCRAAEDESTPLDGEGYCENCRSLPRCIAHADLIAVGNCKSCRREYCRKCLGFTDVCQSCQSRQKTRPLNDRGGATAAAASGAKGAKKARKTAPMDSGGQAAKGTKGAKGKGTSPPEGEGGKPVKKRSRGQVAIEEKLRAKREAKQSRTRTLILASVAAAFLLVLVSGTYMHAMSPEAQEAKLRDQMVAVHRAVTHHYRLHREFPQTAEDIKRALDETKAKGGRRIKVVVGNDIEPNAVIYQAGRSGSGFTIQAADAHGALLLTPNDQPYFLDQYYEPAP